MTKIDDPLDQAKRMARDGMRNIACPYGQTAASLAIAFALIALVERLDDLSEPSQLFPDTDEKVIRVMRIE